LLMNGQVTVGDIQEDVRPKIEAIKQVAKVFKMTNLLMPTFDQFKSQSGMAARGNIDDATIMNMYNAHCKKVENDQGKKKRN